MSNCIGKEDYIEGLWINARDSLEHALDHFVELTRQRSARFHHHKWIIISVYQAASCLANMWLKDVAPENSIFYKDGKESFPFLEDSMRELNRLEENSRLSQSERCLLETFKKLSKIRNKLMHRIPPKEIDEVSVAFAATSIVGIYHSIARRKGLSFSQIFKADSNSGQAIIEAIHYSRVEDYIKFIEDLMIETYSEDSLHFCPDCEARTAFGYNCQACFEKGREANCDSCDENLFVLDSHSYFKDITWYCPECETPYPE